MKIGPLATLAHPCYKCPRNLFTGAVHYNLYDRMAADNKQKSSSCVSIVRRRF